MKLMIAHISLPLFIQQFDLFNPTKSGKLMAILADLTQLEKISKLLMNFVVERLFRPQQNSSWLLATWFTPEKSNEDHLASSEKWRRKKTKQKKQKERKKEKKASRDGDRVGDFIYFFSFFFMMKRRKFE